MSLHPQPPNSVPEETARVAQAAFPDGNTYMRMRDHFGALFSDDAFAQLFPTRGQPAEAPARLAFVTILQFAEGLSDAQAATAVRARIDWKYALGLELTDSGFDASVFCEVRTRLVAGGAEQQLLDTLLARFREAGLLKARGKQRTDSTHVLGAIRAINRLECVGEALLQALNRLAEIAPDWLRAHSQPDWVERYGPRVEDYRLPSGQEKRQEFAETIGRDGWTLLTAALDPAAPTEVHASPAVETLSQIWIQNYVWEDEHLRWRTNDEIPPAAQFISSPYDVEAHYGKKRSTTWVGYKVHVTETCDEDSPHLITDVTTTAAPLYDGNATGPIQKALSDKDLLPTAQSVDTGYAKADQMVSSQKDYGVDLIGPPRADYHWQAHAEECFAAQDSKVDWATQQAICPQGHLSHSWTPALDHHGTPVIKVKFSSQVCGPCPCRIHCTKNQKRYPRRTVTLPPQERYEALQAARERQKTEAFKQLYALRAGIEGTLSQGIRAFDLRRSRYLGLAKTHLQHLAIAAALNLVRVSQWLAGEPLAKTRHSAFERLWALPVTG